MKTKLIAPLRRTLAGATMLALTLIGSASFAQNGLSDERVSLPDGPGSIGGIGENVGLNLNMGSASFQVPISVPTGANGAMTPAVTLNYASGQGMGIAGIGWGMAAPSVERMVHKGLPTYTTADFFASDGGNELVYITQLDGTRVYRERFESGFVRYRWRDAGAGAAGYWTAEYPDGRVGYYGADAAGTLVPSARVQNGDGDTFRYHLVEIRDTVGRRIVYTYAKTEGYPNIAEIQYAFGGQATPRFAIRMAYEDRGDITSMATPGFEIRQTKRLGTIQVLSEATTIRRYELGYETDAASGGMTRLATVSEFGRDGGKHPIEHRFEYTRTLAGACTVGCEQPFMVDMGTLSGGVDIQTGRASLIDINGDSLPDVLETSETGVHRFHISRLSTEGRPGFTGDVVTSSSTTGGSSFILSDPRVQLLDVNGDGFTDIVDQSNSIALCNNGTGDWAGTNCIDNPGQLPALADDPDDAGSESDPLGARFFDYDNDKKIDLLRTPDGGTAFVSRNTGEGYVSVTVDSIGAAFDAEALELTDINGDGLQDPTMLVASGSSAILQYKINLGFGRWPTAWTTIAIDDLSSASLDLAEFEDLDGDGLADIVVVSGTTINYWRNRNGGRFDARVTITSADVTGDIPERTESETVVFADMNGNGTDDIVWIASNGHVRFLELFPVRPNLLSRIENGIGWVRVLEYGTSVAQRARDAGTPNEWQTPLPQSMNVVVATDNWVTLTGGEDGQGVHERKEMTYRDGYYDGDEKAFRGFERVEQRFVTDADDNQDPGLEINDYDVGRNDVYRNGLLVRKAGFGGPNLDVPMREKRTEYSDCPVAEVEGADPAVRFICPTKNIVIHQEGAAPAKWLTTQTDLTYNGYGRVIEQVEHGVRHMGTPEAMTACGACPAFATGLYSGACGADCLGDERITTSTYVMPGSDTGGAWLPGLPVKETVSAAADVAGSEATTYYDGEAFIGLAEGEATKGLATRVSKRVSGDTAIDTNRTAWDALGNAIATLDPNGTVADATQHRREYTYDDRGLRITKITVRAGDYDLVQDITYESSFLKVSEATAFRVVQAGTDLTPTNPSRYTYDEHSRVATIANPGFSREAPTLVFDYALGDPVSRIGIKGRRTPGGPLDYESALCQDGRARTFQSRSMVDEGNWRVDGFVEFNAMGRTTREFRGYGDTTGDCASTPPETDLFKGYHYDAVGRIVEETFGDASIFGTVSTNRLEYAPLTVTNYDALDNDSGSPHFNTPETRVWDGLSRTIQIQRLLTAAGTPETFKLAWDAIGNLARVEDPAGNLREQEFDQLGRLVRTVDANSGTTTFTYDAAGNRLARVDARGITTRWQYDALNREVLRYDAADMEGTSDTTTYDLNPDCEACRNGAGRVVSVGYPLPGDQRGRDELGYDVRGNQTLLRRTLEDQTFDTAYTYDGDDQRLTATYPDGQTLSYSRDDLSRLTGVAGVIANIEYDPAGPIAKITHANGVVESFMNDALLRRTAGSVVGASETIFDWSVTLDRVGNVLVAADTTARAGHPSQAGTFAYDAHYRLTQAVLDPAGGAPETMDYTYDALDNMLSRTSSLGQGSPAHVGAYTYGGSDAGPNAATTIGQGTAEYDAAGYTTTRDELTFAWDHLGRLIEAAKTTPHLSELGYTPDNDRVFKTESGGVTYYPSPDFVVRDGIASLYVMVDGRPVARLQSDALAATLLPDVNSDSRIDISDAWLGRATTDATPSRLLRSAARRLLFTAGDATTATHTDFRGSIVATTDAAGALVAERSFYPFGTERRATGWLDALDFTGKERDTASGLLHFQERYLDTTSGRWLSPDPYFAQLDTDKLGRRGEAMAGYAYGANNPIALVDPTGEFVFALFIKPLRKKVFPNRDRKGAKVNEKSVAKKAAKREKRLNSSRGQAATERIANNNERTLEIDTRLAAMPAQESVTDPAQAKEYAAERKSLEREKKLLSANTAGARSFLDPISAGNKWLIPDMILTSAVAAGLAIGGAAAGGMFDADADDGGDDSGGLSGLYGGGN